MLEYEGEVLHVHVNDMEQASLDGVYARVHEVMQGAPEGLAVLLYVHNAKTIPQLFRLQAFLDRLMGDHGEALKQCVHVLGVTVSNGMIKHILKPYLANFVSAEAQSRIFVDVDKARAWVLAAVNGPVADEEFCDSPG